ARPLIWIHAPSVGEVKAAQPLLLALKSERPSAFFFMTATTLTGLAEAKRTLGAADAHAFCPLDFSFNVRRWVKALRPALLILIEADIWPNLLKEVRRAGGKTVLVSGKMSERSFARFSRFPFLGRKLFGRLDQVLVQNEEQLTRFSPFHSEAR